MYKVFINESVLMIPSNSLENTLESAEIHYFNDNFDVKFLLKKLLNRSQQIAIVHSNNHEEVLNHLKLNVQYIEAAGGIVRNKNNDILVIFRNGKWDLPKGKIELGENPSEAALREVEEECGLSDLVCHELIDKTYHIYEHKGNYTLKCTYWYAMTSSFSSNLIPQLEEGIVEVKWADDAFMRNVFVKNTYNTLLPLVKEYVD